MAQRSKRSPSTTRTSRRQSSSTVLPALSRVWRFARPSSASQFLALALMLLAAGTFLALSIGALFNGQRLGANTLWCALFVLSAAAARFAPWWREHLASMTEERARQYAGCLLLVWAAASISWHLVGEQVGGDTYGLLGPFAGQFAPAALAALLLVAAVLILGLPLGPWLRAGGRLLAAAGRVLAGRMAKARARRLLAEADVSWLAEMDAASSALPAPSPTAPREDIEVKPLKRRRSAKQAEDVAPPAPVRVQRPHEAEHTLPPLEIFKPAPKQSALPGDLDSKARRIEETLASFNVSAKVVDTHTGPVVTQFDVQPDRGVKVRRITELQNDLALALAAPSIRIQAPVPGRPVVGIEIPNSSASVVALRDILESDLYHKSQAPLRVALGKDVAGHPAVIDLAKMPHLLIAGATGSGKSVCVNGIISCLLYQNTPDDVRLMMVDPKMVELTVYNGVPHLLSPVVTQMDKVVGVLQWAIREMERRYQLFADTAVRNITRYNEKMLENGLKKLPYIVLVVDELADLMMVAPEDVEDAICRLAQLARAAGIHLVIATQRPSVDVVTGLIKANFPARIAFAMTSQVDSRTILDRVGAEKLLGRGDMLYQPPDGPAPLRLQGAFLSDQEIEELVEFWKQSPLRQAAQQVPAEEFAVAEKAAAESGDELLDEAVRVVREYQHASVSLLQRRLRVGYSRAARLMDQLEERGVVGPADGSRQRPVFPEDDVDIA